MNKIKAQRLTHENFRNYGSFQNLYDITNRLEHWEDGGSGFYPDLIRMSMGGLSVGACLCRVRKDEGNIITFTEYHRRTAEGILPLDGDCIIHAGKNFGGVTPDKIQAFYVPKGCFVSLNPGVLHGKQIVYNQDLVHILVLLPEFTYASDCEFVHFAKDDQIEVEY